MKRQSLSRGRTYPCSAGQCSAEADHRHPKLDVPVCGKCHKQATEAILQNSPAAGVLDDLENCIWCGNSDGWSLFICDTCAAVYCDKCCSSNFTPAVVQEIRDADPWSCFACCSTDYFRRVQLPPDAILLNLDDIYATIKPPTAEIDSLLSARDALSPAELRLASICSDVTLNNSIIHMQIFHYLSAFDLPHLTMLSSPLRRFFQAHNSMPIVGLFKTPFGAENNCRLHPHQVNSLHRMRQLETAHTAFGQLRGGIFGDEPGLGKTVTTLALVLATAGTLPQQPALFWDTANLQACWLSHKKAETLQQMLLPVLNKVEKQLLEGRWQSDAFKRLHNANKGPTTPATIQEFEARMKATVRGHPGVSSMAKDRVLDTFRMSMITIKAGLDKASRARMKSPEGKRVLIERSLRPSAATLIIVPLALLEHWYEQIVRHVGLHYFSKVSPAEVREGEDYIDTRLDWDDDTRAAKKRALRQRGIVYLDGIGDIADVQAPLSKLQVTSSLDLPLDVLASYLLVITTFERCHQQFTNTIKLSGMSKKAFSALDREFDVIEYECITTIPLLQIRWLRLVVDEGHELGQGTGPSDATLFISEIAAERRWVMSGTPTSALNSRVGLVQLQRLLRFLRHETFGVGQEGLSSWKTQILETFTTHQPEAFQALQDLLRSIMVRHLKSDIHLHTPIYDTITLDQIVDNRDIGMHDEKARRVDRAIATFIMEQLTIAKANHRRYLRASLGRNTFGSPTRVAASEKEAELQNYHRRPKFILFAENSDYMSAVAHFLYLGLGDQSVCEHFGIFRSTELSRFRHSKRTFRVCPLCNHKNPAHCVSGCERTLLRVRYDPRPPEVDVEYEPSAGGHSAAGPGGHLKSVCLCNIEEAHVCNSFYPNALREAEFDEAIIAEEHIASFERGQQWLVGQRIMVLSAPVEEGAGVLWKSGRLGGWATIQEWKRCGGKQPCWHGARILQEVPWKVEEEDASILLLATDGSHGLDLSFVTNIFLLERLKDKALQEQIVSRANRMGATGPVKVTTVLVRAAEDEEIE